VLKINYTQSDNFLSVFINSKIFVVQRSDHRYDSLVKALSRSDYDLVNRYVDPTVALNLKRLTVRDSVFFWDERALPENFYQIFLSLISKNRSMLPYLHFVLDNIDLPDIKKYIEFISQNCETIIPYDMSGKFFVTRSKNVSDRYPSFLIFVEDDSVGDITESTYFENLELKFGPGMLFFLKKEKYPYVVGLSRLHSMMKNFEYSREDVQWAYSKLVPIIRNYDLSRTIGFFKTFEKFKNWVNKSKIEDIKEAVDQLRIDAILEFADELFQRSNDFGEFSRLMYELSSKIKFKAKIINFKHPAGLNKFTYNFRRKGSNYNIRFAKTNYDLYSWGLKFHNCAAGYTNDVVFGDSLVFVVEIDGNDEIIGELKAFKKDGFVGKIQGKTIIKKVFDRWGIGQFKLSHNIETFKYKNEVIKMLKEIGLDIDYITGKYP
jgi:hypothetical protein